MIEAATGSRPSVEHRDAVFERSDGIPFFDDERPAGELDHYVAISACAPEQSAFEQKIQGVSCGRFTFGLVRALSQRAPGASWRNVAARGAG